MQYEAGKSYAWFTAHGRGYAAVFAYPGNKRTRMFCEGGKVVQFTSATDAIAAAQMQVRKVCEPDIRSTIAEEVQPAADVLDVAGWQARKVQQQIEDRKVFRGLGKGFLTVETKRRRA
ncbi:hypothetical protein ACLNGM_14970 [Aureimonas phyllosphaerae]|uniref:hypothetical protein n=1 Tax=Aureimonas phyllosphaerae TaxID=1166078 RepID=UPI003A5BCB3F